MYFDIIECDYRENLEKELRDEIKFLEKRNFEIVDIKYGYCATGGYPVYGKRYSVMLIYKEGVKNE